MCFRGLYSGDRSADHNPIGLLRDAILGTRSWREGLERHSVVEREGLLEWIVQALMGVSLTIVTTCNSTTACNEQRLEHRRLKSW